MKGTRWHTNTPWTLVLLILIIFGLNSCGGGSGGGQPTPGPGSGGNNGNMDIVPPPPPGSDLVIAANSVSDSTLTPGQQFTLRVTVRNQGSVQAPATTLRYKSDPSLPIISSDTTVGTDSVSSLAPSTTSSESITLTAPSTAGTYYYGACVDSVSGERNTDNNCSGNEGVRVTVSSSGGGSPGGGSGGSRGINFRITDACNDGYDMNYRFFANDASSDVIGVWPEAGRVYVTRRLGETYTHTLACTSDTDKICYGAQRESSSGDNSYWGVGLDGDEGCSGCCYSCPSSGSVTGGIRLTCS